MLGKPALPLLLYAEDPILWLDPAPGRTGESDSTEVETHSKAEVWRAIVALGHPGVEAIDLPASPAWRWLRTAARYSVRRFALDDPMRDYEDLLQEALRRLLAGDRSWRRKVEFKYQVARVMDSIASDWRRRAEARPEICEAGLEPPEGGEDDFPDGVLEAPAPGTTAEVQWIVKEQLEEIVGRLEDDAEALQVVGCFYVGLSYREMRQRTGMSKKRLRAAIRRIRRQAVRQEEEAGGTPALPAGSVAAKTTLG